MGYFKGKVFTVTGGASGMARETVLILAKKGAIVYASDVNGEGLKQTATLAKDLPGKVVTSVVDMRNQEAVEKWVNDCFETERRLDGSANCAGVNGVDTATNLENIKQKDWDFIIGVNLTGVLNCMRAQIPHLARPGGSIVNISSTLGLFGQQLFSAYAASKHGVIGLTRSSAAECGRAGIRINAICPGPIDTQIFRDCENAGMVTADEMGGTTLLGRMGQPEEVARVIVFLLGNKSSYVTGAVWPVDAGFTATSI